MQNPQFKVLLVEDHQDTCELYAYVLEQCNYEVLTAGTVSETLALLKTQKFDIYLLDSWLTDGSGIEICERIRKSDSVTPILFCSGLAFEKDKQEALSAGAQDYLVKPLDLNGLCEKVDELVGKSRIAPASALPRATRRESGDLPLATVSA